MDSGFGTGGELAGGMTPAVQPRGSEPDPAELIEPAELRQFDSTSAARYLARIAADQEIMLRLSVEGFDGGAWTEVSEALVQYGWTVMRAWIVTGVVFAKCAERHLGGPKLAPPTGGMRRDDALALADDTVADAIVNFRDKVLARGHWDPSRGASLATFFIGNCLLRFVNNYRKWRSLMGREDATDVVEPEPRASDDPAAIVVADERVRELLGAVVDPQNQAILQLDAVGHSLDEIAGLLDMTYKQVEARLYRTRQQLGRGNQKAG
jgi:DNA-directed RNA polymerase specialized sigma24 family protein